MCYTPETESLRSFLNLLQPGYETVSASSYYPNINISETDNIYELEIFAPGLSKSEFEIEIKDDLLIISAEIKQQSRNYIIKELAFNSFTRHIKLSEDIDQENIDASYKRGVLTIKLQKQIKKQIKIEVK